MEALAEDHINDVASNLAALLAAGVVKVRGAGALVAAAAAAAFARRAACASPKPCLHGARFACCGSICGQPPLFLIERWPAAFAHLLLQFWHAGWWVDGAAAILIALIIMLRWSVITYSQVRGRPWRQQSAVHCSAQPCAAQRVPMFCWPVASPCDLTSPTPAAALPCNAHACAAAAFHPASQVLKIVGQAAPEAFTCQVQALAAAHHPSLEVDVVRWAAQLRGCVCGWLSGYTPSLRALPHVWLQYWRAVPPPAPLAQRTLPSCTVHMRRCYHFGPRYNVEMEVVLPGSMTVAESHDIALELQHKVGGCAAAGLGVGGDQKRWRERGAALSLRSGKRQAAPQPPLPPAAAAAGGAGGCGASLCARGLREAQLAGAQGDLAVRVVWQYYANNTRCWACHMRPAHVPLPVCCCVTN